MILKRISNATVDEHANQDEKEITDSVQTKSSKCGKGFQTFKGIIFCVLGSVCFTLTYVIVKKLKYVSSDQLSTVRMSALWALSLPIAVFSTKEVFGKKKERPLLAFRGLVNSTGLYLSLMAFKYLPLAQASIILSTVPAVTSVIARFYLKEPCGIVQCVAILLTIGAVLLSVRLPKLLDDGVSAAARIDSEYVIGLASATACVFVYSITTVMIRKMRLIHYSVINVYAGFIGMITNGAITIVSTNYSVLRCGWDQVLVILVGLFGFLGLCLGTLAMQLEHAGIVSVLILALKVVTSVLADALFFNVVPDVYVSSATCLVILSVTIIFLRKWVNSLPETSSARKRLGFIML